MDMPVGFMLQSSGFSGERDTTLALLEASVKADKVYNPRRFNLNHNRKVVD